ncbi:MAG TPA: hypothetical protein VNQ14_12760 [Woeseiaceae bacterium]|nr:hypothetical protein [Woeseiaceae bacterium]
MYSDDSAWRFLGLKVVFFCGGSVSHYRFGRIRMLVPHLRYCATVPTSERMLGYHVRPPEKEDVR